ncbi:DUF6518 family protein [Herbiconiux sp. KACC 21604]|uniref:DUF6518 family protein n=1 Tax=unclassified Herbiconiux TaxID=2618217 RepID=UPI0014913D0F|nr:DUF6518 family protein [Herbiconiux sp. SALV-R1]QJU55154.1 hypothetical protein HL652_17050 [Herbiconiux sp. SALV-R1]WPO86309.1 DUF6518 family protein [Herbiconiux sp. KACC 21604]
MTSAAAVSIARHRRALQIAAGLAACVVLGLVLGGLTSVGQTLLPSGVTSFANSTGGWTMLAFAAVWLTRLRPLPAAFGGVLVYLALVEGYALVSAWRGFFYADPFSTIWTVIAVVAGPVIGIAASWVRSESPTRRMLAVAPLSAALLGEGVWALNTIADTTGWFYWALEIALALVFLVVAVVRVRPRMLVLAGSVAAALGGAAAYGAALVWANGG